MTILSISSVFIGPEDEVTVTADDSHVCISYPHGSVNLHFPGGIRDVLKFMAKFQDRDTAYERYDDESEVLFTPEDAWTRRMEG